MRKIFFIAIAVLSIASASVFGMYGIDTDWIDFLTHGNQFRARLEQLGFTLGNDTIRGTFGFDNNKGFGGEWGTLVRQNGSSIYYDFVPTISAGIGYTSSAISVGVGYNATIGQHATKTKDNKSYNPLTHTPVLVLNALDNAFRMAIPIQVYVDNDEVGGTKTSKTAVSVDSQFRYYTGLESLTQIRLYLRYGYYGNKTGDNKGTLAESFGFDFRLYFASMVEEVALQPFIKIVYNTALGRQHNYTEVRAVNAMRGSYTTGNGRWQKGAWSLAITPVLGLSANSDVVSIYVEPSLGLKINQPGSATDKNNREVYSLGYGVYGEVYVRPLQNLEWYFEAELGNLNSSGTSTSGNTTTTTSVTSDKYLGFNASTGITWYLPAL